jgi:hypothetical protein
MAFRVSSEDERPARACRALGTYAAGPSAIPRPGSSAQPQQGQDLPMRRLPAATKSSETSQGRGGLRSISRRPTGTIRSASDGAGLA